MTPRTPEEVYAKNKHDDELRHKEGMLRAEAELASQYGGQPVQRPQPPEGLAPPGSGAIQVPRERQSGNRYQSLYELKRMLGLL